LSVLLLDNMIQNIVMIFLFQIIRRTGDLNRKFSISQSIDFLQHQLEEKPKSKKPFLSVFIAIVLTAGVVVMKFSFITNVIILSILGLIIGNVLKFWSFNINLKIGSKKDLEWIFIYGTPKLRLKDEKKSGTNVMPENR